jgi:hypothetical protein
MTQRAHQEKNCDHHGLTEEISPWIGRRNVKKNKFECGGQEERLLSKESRRKAMKVCASPCTKLMTTSSDLGFVRLMKAAGTQIFHHSPFVHPKIPMGPD